MTSLSPASALRSPSPAPAAPFNLSPQRPVPLSIKSRPFRIRSALNPNPRPESLLSISAASIAAALAAAALSGLGSPPLAIAAVAAADVDVDVTSETTSPALSDAERERILEAHVAENPKDIAGLRSLMEAKVKAGKIPEAVSAIDKLIEIEPGERDLPILRSHMLLHNGDFAAAREGFEALLASDPLFIEAYHGLVMVAHKSDQVEIEIEEVLTRVEDALQQCKKEGRKDDVRDFKLLIAQIKVIEGDYDESLKIYKDLVKEEPKDFRPYLCQGVVYTILQKKDEADKQFEKYRKLVPSGHPYARFFDEGMTAMKVLGQAEDKKKHSAMKN